MAREDLFPGYSRSCTHGGRGEALYHFFGSGDNYHRREESEAHMFLVVKQSPGGAGF